jgi:hypothetical protein
MSAVIVAAMRRIALIVGLVLITGLIIHEIYEFFVTNEGVRYFASEPRQLWHLVLLGVAGGGVAFGISRLSPGLQRTLKLATLGTFGTCVLGGLGLFAYHLLQINRVLNEADMRVGSLWRLCLSPSSLSSCGWSFAWSGAALERESGNNERQPDTGKHLCAFCRL